ncbi:MAG: HAMP domain-containing histidine kinase [Clostridia bacterium]|nr:HAMP domain-containing histidine kinase [Clostridia bacterium]
MMSALAVVFMIQTLARGNVREFAVDALQKIFGMTFGGARELYLRIIFNNLDYILLGAVVAFFMILSRFMLSQFSKYFMEISDGLDVLVGKKDRDIALSSEMAAMESKLKAIKQTLKDREQEARLSEQRKNDMVMYLAHDIKTPLTSVIGYLSLLDEAPDMPPEQKAKYVHITLNKASRLEKLVDEFFEITRYNFQTGSLSKESIDLYTMLAQMTDEFYPLLAAKGMRAVLHVPEDMVIYGDSEKLARVFNNVLKNAIAYSPDKSDVDITGAIFRDTASVVFTNAGSLSKDKLTAVFEKFYRLDSARSSDTGGAGLGLAIAKEIIVSHGGRIYADSDGGQTSFTVEIPYPAEQSLESVKGFSTERKVIP